MAKKHISTSDHYGKRGYSNITWRYDLKVWHTYNILKINFETNDTWRYDLKVWYTYNTLKINFETNEIKPLTISCDYRHVISRQVSIKDVELLYNTIEHHCYYSLYIWYIFCLYYAWGLRNNIIKYIARFRHLKELVWSPT